MCLLLLLLLFFDPGTQFPGNEKNYAMQYKKYKNQAGMNLTLPPPSQNSHYYYYYAAFNAPCVGHKNDESQARCAHVPDYFGNLLLTLRFRFVFRLS